MLKVLKYVSLFFFALLWVVGCHPVLRREAFELGVFEDDYRYGDLYRLSNLAQFKQPTQRCPKKYPDPASKKNTALYIIGDSFTEKQRISEADFIAAAYRRVHWADSLEVTLDTAKRNILVLETVERSFRQHFAVPVRALKITQGSVHKETLPATAADKDWTEILKESEEALTGFLFSSHFFLHLKDRKAALNLRWFGRHNDQVALSPDGKHLLFCWDTDAARLTSSFHPLPDNELDTLVQHINRARTYYRSLGFDEVYLSVIPNKTSIVASDMGPYNHLIERAQRHPALQAPVIDTRTAFVQHADRVYALGDTHWTCYGQEIWLEKVNALLR